ncbi:hypothetical protein F1559_000684 [Cyanidiococcus yangmingshanensis]|uniref:Uncharacterized protein n=1 Tax=Cyanidiococcus yangmingshanensis TaxID=2690220 RepID=A0A7J7IPQ4_9RHOD|nr:hypothetical protein F1559_000684 [Cyanidiococcus yangmingshanensis]
MDAVQEMPQSPVWNWHVGASQTAASAPYTSVPFPSHVRNAFKRSGGTLTERHDATGELVRLLDDLSTEFRWIAARARETYAKGVQVEPLTAALVTQQLYFALCHDGYACLLVSKDQPEPMCLPPDMPSGSYVIVLVSLDADVQFAPAEGVMGSLFSVYKRKTAPGRAGRREDLQVCFGGPGCSWLCVVRKFDTALLQHARESGCLSLCAAPSRETVLHVLGRSVRVRCRARSQPTTPE